jgi:hypothetical protein
METTNEKERLARINIPVTGMTCASCVRRVERAFRGAMREVRWSAKQRRPSAQRIGWLQVKAPKFLRHGARRDESDWTRTQRQNGGT